MNGDRVLRQRTYLEGVPSWIDSAQPDVDAAVEFYSGLLGWTFEDVMPPGAPGRYLIAKLNGQEVAGLAGGGDGTPRWSTYTAVDDADAAVQRLTAAGAAVFSPPADAGEGGRSAALTDPRGVEFRLWQAKRRLGAQSVNAPGTWNFSDLHTDNPSAAIAFYGEAFGWQVDAFAFVVPTAPGEPPHWHVTFAVGDRDQTVEDAKRLGAEVLTQDETEWTRDALIRDPQGAEFTGSQFTAG